MTYLAPLRSALLALRSGERTFASVSVEAGPLVHRRAAMLARRWRSSQELLDDEDLYQVMMLALWRAAETFDPDRGVDVARYADVQLQHAAREALRKAAGYPDPRRKSVARRVYVESVESIAGTEDGDQEVAEIVRTVLRRLPTVGSHRIIRSVAEYLLRGLSAPEAAREIYRDPDLRLRYRLDSEEAAERACSRAAQHIRQETAAALAG